MKKQILKIIALSATLFFSSVAVSESVNEDPINREMLDIAAKLRCTVCQNQPVSESHSGLAIDMRNLITEKLKQGSKEPEIIQFFVDRFGDYVLLKPPTSGNGTMLWIMPPLLLLFAIVLAVVMMKSRGENKTENESLTLSDADKERVRRARKADVAAQNNIGEDH